MAVVSVLRIGLCVGDRCLDPLLGLCVLDVGRPLPGGRRIALLGCLSREGRCDGLSLPCGHWKRA